MGLLLPHRPGDDRVDLVHVLVGHAFTHTKRRGGAAGDDDERVLEFVGAGHCAARFEHRRQPGGLRLLGGQGFGVLDGESDEAAHRACVGDPLGGYRAAGAPLGDLDEADHSLARDKRDDERRAALELQHRVLGCDSVGRKAPRRQIRVGGCEIGSRPAVGDAGEADQLTVVGQGVDADVGGVEQLAEPDGGFLGQTDRVHGGEVGADVVHGRVRAEQGHLTAVEARGDPGHDLGDHHAEHADEDGEAHGQHDVPGLHRDGGGIGGHEQRQHQQGRAGAVRQADRRETDAEHRAEGVGEFAVETDAETDQAESDQDQPMGVPAGPPVPGEERRDDARDDAGRACDDDSQGVGPPTRGEEQTDEAEQPADDEDDGRDAPDHQCVDAEFSAARLGARAVLPAVT